MSLGKIRPNLIFYLIFPPVHLLAESLEISNGRYTQTYQMFCLHGDEKRTWNRAILLFRKSPWKPWFDYTHQQLLLRPDIFGNESLIWSEKNWKACAACSTSYNGQIEQFINLYKIPLVTLHPLTIFHWNVWFASSPLSKIGVLPCSNVANFKSIKLILLKGKFHNRLSERAHD